MRVLLVEDSEPFATHCRMLLTALRGVQVVKTASTEQEACDWLRENPRSWDLAVVDLFLGKGNGFRVLQACRERASMQRAVVLSNYADVTARQYAGKAGADGFFNKASELDGLVDFCAGFAGEVYAASRSTRNREVSADAFAPDPQHREDRVVRAA
jgi:ActR/RegA family two-component response regulator